MIVTLEVPYADTTAADLGFALGLAPQPALRVLDLPGAAGPRTHLQLRLLGTSHQALLSTADAEVSETVACLPPGSGELPADGVTVVMAGGWRYRFRARVRQTAPGPFATLVAALVAAGGRDGPELLGQFPGQPGAVTALRARPGPDRLVWRTVHAYPQTGEIVRTLTTVDRPVAR